jgi:hypothetical protein
MTEEKSGGVGISCPILILDLKRDEKATFRTHVSFLTWD